MTMPGLPKVPAANNIDVNENGTIVSASQRLANDISEYFLYVFPDLQFLFPVQQDFLPINPGCKGNLWSGRCGIQCAGKKTAGENYFYGI